MEDTIAAISTAPADGAISIVRMSGPDAIEIANQVFDRDLSKKDSHTITYGTISKNGQPIDEVLVSLFRAPRTYTKEDIVEINCHGGRYVTRQILQLLLEKGARLANPGEFTQRAFLNGRIDLSQAESVEAMIEAGNDQALKLAISGLKGSAGRLIVPLIDDLTDVIAQIEVNIDYPEYDVEQLTYASLLPRCTHLLERMNVLIESAKRALLYKDGIDTVILGKPNVGKSSLLNALIEEEKAIVTDIEGTTRDIVEGKIRVGSTQINLIDTAGIREAKDVVEKIGIDKSLEKLNEAALVLLVLDGTRNLDKEDERLLELTKDKNRILLINKSDQPSLFSLDGAIEISAREGNIEPLFAELKERFESQPIESDQSLSTLRQLSLLESARSDMMKAIEAMEMETEPDLIEIDLLACLDHLKEIIGKAGRDDLLDTLFSNFCLGK